MAYSKEIVNAAPFNNALGTDDQSGRTVPVTPPTIPYHLPKFFLKTMKGPIKPKLVAGDSLLNLFGAEGFNKNSKFFNHQTLGAQTALSAGNSIMVQRIVPDDANPEANVTLYMDVLSVPVPNYLRNSDGGIVTDSGTGEPVVDTVTPTVDGYKVKFIKEWTNTGITPGSAVSKTGTMEELVGENIVTSTMYPIYETTAGFQGAYYNNVGFSFNMLTEDKIAPKIISDTKAIPYEVSIIKRADVNSTGKVFASKFGENAVKTVFKKGGINPLTESEFDITTLMPSQWHNETDPLFPEIISDIGEFYFYYDNLETLLNMFVTAELPYRDVTKTWEDGIEASSADWYDFINIDDAIVLQDELHLFNWMTLKTISGTSYTSVMTSDVVSTLTANQKEVTMGKGTPIYLDGGSDGSVDNATYEAKVREHMQDYIDINSRVIDTAINVESMIYDTGFTLETKKELCNFIALRKDTGIVLSTRDMEQGDLFLTVSEARAVAVVLNARLALTPESEYFGTPVARGVIVMGSGKLSSDLVRDRLPLTLELLYKASSYMSGIRWKASKNFDNGNNSIITLFKEIENEFIPEGVKPVLWDAGLVYAQPFDRVQYHFPAVQTVYSDDTSVLNSFPTMMAIIALNKIADQAHRAYTGNSSMTDAEFKDAVVGFVNEAIKGKFDNRFVIQPKVILTEVDKARGYSFTLENTIYANNMRTVMTSYVVARRMSDLA